MDLDRQDRNLQADQQRREQRPDLARVAAQQIAAKLLDVVVDGAAFFGGADDTGEVVVPIKVSVLSGTASTPLFP